MLTVELGIVNRAWRRGIYYAHRRRDNRGQIRQEELSQQLGDYHPIQGV